MKSIQEIDKFYKIPLDLLSEKEIDTYYGKIDNHAARNQISILRKAANAVALSVQAAKYPTALRRLRELYNDFLHMSTDKRLVESSFELAKDIEKQAVRLHAYDMAAECASLQLAYYSKANDEIKFDRTAQRHKEYIKIRKYEGRARRSYQRMHMWLRSGSTLTSERQLKINGDAKLFKSVLHSIDSAAFQLQARLVILKSLNESELNEFLQESYDYFDGLHFTHRPGIATFGTFLIQSLSNEGNFLEAQRMINRQIKLYRKSDYNYNRLQEVKLVVHMRAGEYEAAQQLFDDFTRRRGRVPESIRDRLSIYKVFHSIMDGDIASVRIKKISNDLDHYKKDRQGMHLSLLIAEVALMAGRGQTAFLIDKKEAVMKFLQRYGLNFSREAAFIRLLFTLKDENNINSHRSQEKIIKELGIMASAKSLEPDLEVIPFEDIWTRLSDQYIQKDVSMY